MILLFYCNNRKSTSGRKDCIKRKNTELKKLGVKRYKVRLRSQSNFLPVDFGEGLCNDKPKRKGK
ncbi:MAG: hypothetical protein NC548_40515, partial [Lachnospiraceae bacterium]|nr:hypothetical protein [Lachnospiraceae bacterium]